MKTHVLVEYVRRVLVVTRAEVGEWCGVKEAAVSKWIAWSSGRDHETSTHTPWGHQPGAESAQKLRELRREARVVEAFHVDPATWRQHACRFEDGKPVWHPVWRDFVDYKCADAGHYPPDDREIAYADLGGALLTDDDCDLRVEVHSANLSGTDTAARAFGSGQNWEVLVQKGLSKDRKREEVLRELQGHVLPVDTDNEDGLKVENPLEGIEEIARDSERTVIPDALGRRDMHFQSRAWVLKRSQVAPREKRAIARYVATHIVKPQMLIQIASGTTENCLMDDIVSNKIEDLQVTTNNLQVLVKGLGAAHRGISVNLIGGKLNPSIDSLVGPDAARLIADERVMPHAVFFGAAGLSFQNRLCISYAFEDEEATQLAYATRPTEVRVLMADDSKLGRTCGRRAPVSIEQMIQTADACIVVSNYNDKAAGRLDQEISALRKLLEPLRDREDLRQKDFILRFVDLEGSMHTEYSLDGLRKGSW